MEDVQGRRDSREVALDKVGVSGLRYPIVVLDREHQKQHTVAVLKMSVNLPHEFKGTHMSRFIEVLNEHRGEITMRTVPNILRDLRKKLDAESAHIHLVFPYFLERRAPVSGASALMDYECSFDAAVNGGKDEFVFGVRVPVTSLCPCSKAISDYGAHNQRGYITIEVQTVRDPENNFALVWFEELIDIAEQSASAPVYPLLKRADERHVTMQAFDNPVFVEDMVRNVALALRNDLRIAWFRIDALNQESIHNHSAFASVEWVRPEGTVAKDLAVEEQTCA
ncbi:MAG: GTP cyclohydrolase FolE2 [Acidobacteriia bacterium]|nr:GTP cyclohydrolase FolE2 [Terriglobia bacterium]